jgi:L-iditol 2-dehydrogenase
MKACVLSDVRKMDVREVPTPETAPHQVLVRVAAVGICGTDAHIFAGHANYNVDRSGARIPFLTQPQILGHEISGEIAAVGSEVSGLAPGDRVVVDQGINCHSRGRETLCEYCLSGDSHQCDHYGEHGITGLPGGLAEFVCVSAANVVKLSTDLDLVEAALTEPLGCVLHSSAMVERAHTRFRIGADSAASRVHAILVCGAGPAGLLFIQYLRQVAGYEGALLVSEPEEIKRNLALQLGASEAVNPRQDSLVDFVRDRTAGSGVEYLIEASGQGQVFASIPPLTRRQATVLLYGHGHAGVDLSVLNSVMFKEPIFVTPVGASGGFDPDRRPSTYRQALRLIEDRVIQVAPFITHRFTSLDQVPHALSSMMGEPGYVKGVVASQESSSIKEVG